MTSLTWISLFIHESLITSTNASRQKVAKAETCEESGPGNVWKNQSVAWQIAWAMYHQ